MPESFDHDRDGGSGAGTGRRGDRVDRPLADRRFGADAGDVFLYHGADVAARGDGDRLHLLDQAPLAGVPGELELPDLWPALARVHEYLGLRLGIAGGHRDFDLDDRAALPRGAARAVDSDHQRHLLEYRRDGRRDRGAGGEHAAISVARVSAAGFGAALHRVRADRRLGRR